MEERNSILSEMYYENSLIKSINCYIIDDDLIEITVAEDNIIVNSFQMNSKQLETILEILDSTPSEIIEIEDIPIKKSFLKSLEPIIEKPLQ